jgi:hypothetical protein
MSATVNRYLMLATLAVAVIGIQPALNPGCGTIKVKDPVTGAVRDATPQELQDVSVWVGDIGKVATVSAGQAQWVPFVDVGVRVLALLLAWYQKTEIEKKEKPAPGS